jgi:hypothetical protein
MLKQIFLWLLGTVVVLQIIQIKVPPIPQNINPKDEIQAPKEIMSMIKTSCYDCHSYQTKTPWYGHIAPISWEVKSHIKFGRLALNFQEWNSYDEEKKQKIYKKIVQTINFRMPMPMYLTIHKDARLTKEQREKIASWAKSHIKEDDF